MYYLFFVAITIFHEVHGCLSLIRFSSESQLFSEDGDSPLLSKETVKEALIMKMKSRFSGEL